MNDVQIDPGLPKPKRKEFINYIHNFRGLAIIFVVAGHLLLKWEANSIMHQIFKMIWENGSVLFVFIAGYLFQHLSKKFEYKRYLHTKLQNVIIPYLVVSIPMVVYRLITSDYPGYILSFQPDFLQWSIYKKLLFFLFTGAHLQPLWFVPMITIFYLVAPALLYIDKNPRFYYLIIPFALISLAVGREPFNDIPRMFGYFLSVYLFGMFMSKYKNEYLEFAKRNWIYITLITLVFIVFNYVYFEFNGVLNYIQKMLLCGFFIYWLWKLDSIIPKSLAVLAEVSFGVFFIHYYVLLVIKAIYEKAFNHAIPANIINWVIYLILVLLGSIFIIRCCQKIFKGRSRQIIGC